MLPNEVGVAFDILLEELEMVIAAFNKEGADAFSRGNYEAVRDMSEQAGQLTGMRSKVKELQQEWDRLFAGKAASALHRQPVTKRTLRERLGRGLRTPEEAFRAPILRTLIQLGGSAQVSQVLDVLAISMKETLNAYDQQPLPSDPASPRWRNTAQWCRNSLAREGLLAADSPRGVWAITPSGRAEVGRA